MRKCCRSIKKYYGTLKDIMLRKMLDTEYHKRAWSEYEVMLMYRANLTQFSHIAYFVFFASMGGESFQHSEKIRDEWDPERADLIEAVHPYATLAAVAFWFGRVILLLISIKKLSITRVYFYYELINVVIDQFFPRNVDVVTANLLHLYY